MITLENSVDNYLKVEDEHYSYFAGNNYLGLANHPAMIVSAVEATQKYGINFSASRQTTGTADIHLELEKLLADFCGQEDAIVFASGYMGNMIMLEQLKGRFNVVFADEQAHPSIKDALPCQMPVHFYKHCDVEHLEKLLEAHPKNSALVITDGVFALSGEIAPLDKISCLTQKYGALLAVDEAHSIGVLGENGRGTFEHFHIRRTETIFQTCTLSKAFGAYGGFIAAGHKLVESIRKKSTYYGASTALPPAIVAAGCASVKLVQAHAEWRENLMQNVTILKQAIRKLGFETSADATPVIPIFFEEKALAQSLSAFLEKKHIIAPAVDYPTQLPKYMVRLTVSAKHTEEQINNLLNTLQLWKH